MEILIRPWTREDFPAVRRILWESWIAAYRAFIPEEDLRAYLEATYQIASLSLLYDSSFIHGLIGEADGEAVGFARTQFHKDEKRLYLASLYLLPAYQGKGIGGKLLRAAEERAEAYGLTELWVGVMVRNEAAGRWYDRKGFLFVREEPFRMGRTIVAHRIGYKTIARSSQDADLQRRLFAVYGGDGETPLLADLAAELLERQMKTWPVLAEGYSALESARVREIRGDGWKVKVQFNPRRIVSTGAKLDPESIRKRPCFLCPEHLPPEQQAILYRDDYLVLCNPAPIFPGHLTIAHRRHLPQSLPENLQTLPAAVRRTSVPGSSFSITARRAAPRRPITFISRRRPPACFLWRRRFWSPGTERSSDVGTGLLSGGPWGWDGAFSSSKGRGRKRLHRLSAN